jgi:hypothetical protein
MFKILPSVQEFNYENFDELMQDPENKFKSQFSGFILDEILQSLKEKFLQLRQHNAHFQFLYNRSSLRNTSKEHIIKRCVDLQSLFTDKEMDKADTDELQMVENRMHCQF